MDLNYNSDQFEIGEAVVSSIKSSIDTNNSSIKSDFDKVISVANDYKINLSNTIKFDDLESDFSSLITYLDDVSKSALLAKSAIDSYSESNGTEQDKRILLSVIRASANNSKPNAIVKTVYTGLMGGAMLGEGFLSFFEDVGGCAIVLGSGVAGFFDKKKAQEMRSFASKNLSKDLFENNSTFEKINKYSYFDKNSVYADIFKLGGKAAAAVTVGGVASKAVSSFTKAKSTVVASNISTFGSDTRENLSRGMGLKSSLMFAGASLATTHAVNKFLSPALASKVGETVADTKVGNVIRGADAVASSVFGSNIDNVKNVVQTAVDYSIKETKSKTDNLVSGDGNEKTTNDAVVQDAANLGIDTAKTTGEQVVEKSIERAVVDAVL